MIRLVELFSGIGSQAKALERLSIRRNFEFEVLNTCERDVHALVAYDYIHNGCHINKLVRNKTKEELLDILNSYNVSYDGKILLSKKVIHSFSFEMAKRICSSILNTNNFVNINDLKGNDLPDDITILTYSFPCQDLSNAGAIHGFIKGIDRDANTRSGLLWEVERILKERNSLGLKLPKFLLLENVTNLDSARHKANFEDWQNSLRNLGYINKIYKLYAPDFGIPQNRKRLIMLSVFSDSNTIRNEILNYFDNHNLNDADYVRELNIHRGNVRDFLFLNYDNPIYFNEALACQPNLTNSRIGIWENNPKILDENNVLNHLVSTITTKQDRHPNSGNIFFPINNNKSQYRFLTPRECFVLMGFDERDYERIVQNNFKSFKNSSFFSRDKLYKLAGNSIVVNVLEQVFDQIIDLNEILYGN